MSKESYCGAFALLIALGTLVAVFGKLFLQLSVYVAADARAWLAFAKRQLRMEPEVVEGMFGSHQLEWVRNTHS